LISKGNRQRIAVIGSGAAGLSAAWLLSQQHDVTLVEADTRLGGHAHTAWIPDDPDSPGLAIDTGFIVYNETNYPNLVHWFRELGVTTENSNMSFAVSRDSGNFEYAGGPPLGLFAQPGLLLHEEQSLGDFLAAGGYSKAFVDDHLMPFGAAVWSTSRANMLNYPASAFIQFCDNHGLLNLIQRPQWKTVSGGSDSYVQTVGKSLLQNGGQIHLGTAAAQIDRGAQGVQIVMASGERLACDHAVLATHADTALHLLHAPTVDESTLLGAFAYDRNHAVLHTDECVMPKRRAAWCSWNYVEQEDDNTAQVSVSYWMNQLQNLKTKRDYFVSLNPAILPAPNSVIRRSEYDHPIFTARTAQAQRQLWSLQGVQNTWFCGSYFGAGFHEDAVQSGLAVAEQLGAKLRPWSLSNPSDRIVVSDHLIAQSPC